MFLNDSNWIATTLCGNDLSGEMSVSKITKYIISPLAAADISILAISMYQCDYVLIREKDYDRVIECLSSRIPKIYDESLTIAENEIAFGGNHRVVTKKQPSPKSQSHSITVPLVIPEETEYCITGLYNRDAFILIIPTLIDIMFYETENYNQEEIFFNFIKQESDISLVMETRLLKKFPPGALVNIETDYWKLIRIGTESVGMDEIGICASVSFPLEKENIDKYYISSFHTGYCFIPSDKLPLAKEMFNKQQAMIEHSSRNRAMSKTHSASSDSNDQLTNSDDEINKNGSSIENDLNNISNLKDQQQHENITTPICTH